MRVLSLVLMTGLGLALPLAAQPSPTAQDESGQEAETGGLLTIELRVISTGPGASVTVDRGGSDALEEGDLVLFHPRVGGVLSGAVATVNRRSSMIELHDPGVIPPAGTRGEVRIPRQRLDERAEQRRQAREQRRDEAPPVDPVETEAAEDLAEEAADEEKPSWSFLDEEYTRDLPLLADVGIVLPEDRRPRLTGRYYALADQTFTTDDGRKSGFYRTGAELELDNPFGYGGQLQFEGELNYRNVDVPDNDDEKESTLRVDRLAYGWGGTRFAPVRQDVGRFLQRGMPEFGVLDGYEWSRRTDEGQRYGLSAGFMPEPERDMKSTQDFQLAGWYRWVSDLSERLSASAGFQQTWHNGDIDRDLLVGKFHYLPLEGWSLQGTAWIDYYTGDDEKTAGFGLTQAYLTAHRTFASRDSMSVTYSHIEFPDIDRYEFTPPAQNELEDARNDRLEVSGKHWIRSDQRIHGALGVWIDDEDNGADGELGFEVVLPRSRADITAFGTQGAYSSGLGLRGSYGHYVENGHWDISYEIANQDNQGFADDNDDLIQQRLRTSRDYQTLSGWNLSGYLEADYWEDHEGLTLGFYVQRSF